MNFKNYFEELKRRNVFKAALAYLVVSWVIVQVASIVFPAFRAAPGALRTLILVLLIGFPVWLVFAWVYEVTPDGLKKTKHVEPEKSITADTSNKFNKIIIGALALAILLLGANLYNSYSGNHTSNNIENNIVSDNPAESSKIDRSIAVLAFADMSPQKDQEYFSDGISEEILNYLAKNPELRVISRTSSFSFKGKNTDIREIGQKLNANYVLEGSVRKADSTLRITAQLIHVDDGAHLWSETYDRKMDDIFKIQDEIAEAVTKNLEASLLGKGITEVDTEVYTLYLKAKHLYEQYSNESAEKALQLLDEAVNIDSNYAPVWVLKSEIYYSLGFGFAKMPKEKAFKLGLDAAEKAVTIDPEYAKAYMELARGSLTQFDFKKAKFYVQKAVELEPENPNIIRRKGLISFASVPKVIKDNKKALELDPLLYVIHFNLGLMYHWTGDNEEALKQLNIYEEYNPGTAVTSSLKCRILLELKRIEEAQQEIEKETDPFWKSYQEIKVVYKAGDKDKAVKLLKEFIKTYPSEGTNIAENYAFMGNRDKTFEYLQKALEIKDPTITEGVYYPSFKKFHNDPRWQELLEDMGVPEENGIPGYKKS